MIDAQTTANNALQVVQAAGMTLEEIGSFDENPSGTTYSYNVTLNKTANDYKAILIIFVSITSTSASSFDHYTMFVPVISIRDFYLVCPLNNSFYQRGFTLSADGLKISANVCTEVGGNGVPDANKVIIRKVYGIK